MIFEPYPLQWPDSWAKTPDWKRKPARYKAAFGKARTAVLNSLRLMGVLTEAITISSNIPVRRDGLPYASYARVEQPGIAVYWFREGELRVMACDQWSETAANLWAVHLSLEALRTLQRTGASQIFERAFSAFGALPGNTSNGARAPRHWRDVFGLTLESTSQFEIEEVLATVEALYRAKAKRIHPDKGGTSEAMTELNLAIAQAREELKRG